MPRTMVLLDPLTAGRPEVVELAAANRFRAISVHLFAHVHVTRYGTDGFIHARILPTLHGRKRDASHLCEVGLWLPEGKGWRVLDWSWTQLSRPRLPISRVLRAVIMQRDAYRCRRCGAEDNLSIDHITPWSLGGDNSQDNLQVLCRSCNSRKGTS